MALTIDTLLAAARTVCAIAPPPGPARVVFTIMAQKDSSENLRLQRRERDIVNQLDLRILTSRPS